MIDILKALVPQLVIKYLRLLRSNLALAVQYAYDYKIYSHFNSSKSEINAFQLEGKIIAHYHVLEKGMSHPSPKQCFSLPIAESLINLIGAYDGMNLKRSRQVDVAISVLKKYQVLSTNKGCLPQHIDKAIELLEPSIETSPGFYHVTKKELFEKCHSNFEELARSRYSVRDFTEQDVELNVLIEAVRIAQKTPSVCNRQTSKVYILTKRADICDHLSLQNGNRGFGHKINKLLIVTSDLHYFEGAKERNQAFVDGGMFAMSLLYALHYLMIGAVTLNWAYEKKQDESLHSLGIVPRNEKVILFIGVGHVPHSFKIAVSERRDINEVANVI